MNRLKLITLGLIMMIPPGLLHAQEQARKIVTAEFHVSGVCDECKQRIEKAALIKGVKLAEWNKETQILMVIYKTKHTNEMAIQEAVAAVGHDTGDVTASEVSYDKLPACCAYRDGVETH